MLFGLMLLRLPNLRTYGPSWATRHIFQLPSFEGFLHVLI